jgi:hypothetical protein
VSEEKIEIIQSVAFEYGVIELRSDDILTYEPKEGLTSYSMPQVIEIVRIFKELCNGKPLPTFFNNTQYTESTTGEVKKYTRIHLQEFASVCAMTENSPMTRFFVHAFLSLYKQKVPVKMFKNKEEAIDWLKTQHA